MTQTVNGLLLVDKPLGPTTFDMVRWARRVLGVRKVGHAGTLDPLATGLVLLLIGSATKSAEKLIGMDKQYDVVLHLGITTDSFDRYGTVQSKNAVDITEAQILAALPQFNGTFAQTPPMFSAKKVSGTPLYHHARKGRTIERPSTTVTASTVFVAWDPPFLSLTIACSKGCYIRVLGHELGQLLGCGGHVHTLRRSRVGDYHVQAATVGWPLFTPTENLLAAILPCTL